MDIVQHCDSYINIPSSETYKVSVGYTYNPARNFIIPLYSIYHENEDAFVYSYELDGYASIRKLLYPFFNVTIRFSDIETYLHRPFIP
jgi:hypothetical protein